MKWRSQLGSKRREEEKRQEEQIGTVDCGFGTLNRQELGGFYLRIRDQHTAGCCDGPLLCIPHQTLRPENQHPQMSCRCGRRGSKIPTSAVNQDGWEVIVSWGLTCQYWYLWWLIKTLVLLTQLSSTSKERPNETLLSNILHVIKRCRHHASALAFPGYVVRTCQPCSHPGSRHTDILTCAPHVLPSRTKYPLASPASMLSLPFSLSGGHAKACASNPSVQGLFYFH